VKEDEGMGEKGPTNLHGLVAVVVSYEQISRMQRSEGEHEIT